MRSEFILFFLLPLWSTANVLPDCPEGYVQLLSNERKMVYSPNYLPYKYGFAVPSGCQLTMAAPIYHKLQMSCNFWSGNQSATNCDPGDSFWVQLDGTSRLDNSNARRYCGANQNIEHVSRFNSITIGHTASTTSGYYACNVLAKPDDKCDCGQRPKHKIVAGEVAPDNAYPYFAVLLDAGTSSTVRGGATIISTNMAITASHVFMKNNAFLEPADIFLSVGRSSLLRGINEDTPYSRNYAVEKIIRHPEYSDEESLNDIALIIVSQFFQFNHGVNVACLPGLNEPSNIYDGQRILLMGMGMTDYGGAFSKQLKQAYATVMPNVQCKDSFEELTDDDMCSTTYEQDRNDTCQGDSGGPIILPSFRDFIIGTVKGGIFCGGSFPGKCQRVSPFRQNFIQKFAGPNNFFCYFKN